MSKRVARAASATGLVCALLLAGVAHGAASFTLAPIENDPLVEGAGPETDGAWVVYASKAVLPGANWNIVAKNLRNGQRVTALTGSTAIDDKDQMLPDISMGRVVYEQHTAVSNSDIRMHDLVSGTNTVIAGTSDHEIYPRISGDIVVWKNHTDGELCYKNVRTGAAGTLNPDLGWGIVAWDVDRGRIAYSSGNGLSSIVRVFRPGVDSAPVALPSEIVPHDRFATGMRLHGDTVCITGTDYSDEAESFLTVANISSGTAVTKLTGVLYPYQYATPFHSSAAWTEDTNSPTGQNVYWQEVPAASDASAITVAGTNAAEQNTTLFGRRVVWEQDTGAGDIYAASAAPESHRTFGADRYATAAAASAEYYGKAKNAVLCTGLNFPDALAAAPFARMVEGPLLLAKTTSVPAATMNELKRLGVTKVYVIGGPTTLSPAVVSALNGQGIATERIAGANRYDTANLLATRVVGLATAGGGYSGTAFFARGDAFPDALAVGPVACQARAPIILVQPGFLPASVRATVSSLNVKHGFVIGSQTAVGSGVKSDIDSLLIANGGAATERWSGSNRYATAIAVVNGGLAHRWIDLDTLGVATGENFPDALGGGAALGYYGSGLVLTRAQVLPSEVISFLTAHEYEVGRLDVFGGTGTVSETVKTGIATRLK